MSRILSAAPSLLIIALVVLIVHYMGVFGGFAKKAEVPQDIDFSDVAGCGEAVEELREVQDFLNNPERYKAMGATPPRGVLLYGPPGTGKTLLAKAMAAEAEVPFFSVSGSSFMEVFVGKGASRMRQLFNKAAEQAPSIIFIDELDSVGMKRSGSHSDSASREADQTLNEMLEKMSGFAESDLPVVVIGATNRLESLDEALIRPGRFDRHIPVDPPDRKGRLDILKVHSKGKPISADLGAIADQTARMTGADLELILNEAALLAVRRKSDVIESCDLEAGFMRVVAGPEKQNRAMSDEEKERVAVHEAGHAVVREKLKGADRVHKISIIPRGQSGGQTIMVSDTDIFLHTPNDIRDKIASLLAGRAAEDEVLGTISSGAADDLQKATAISEQFVSDLGMGGSLGLRVASPSSLSSSDRAKISSEITGMLDEEYVRAKQIITENRDVLDRVVSKLLKDETIGREEFLNLLADG